MKEEKMEKKELFIKAEDEETRLSVPSITLVLENGELLLEAIKEAQQQAAELEKTLDRLKSFNPLFRQK
ncbi:hypothetical protein QQG09_09390 [Melissococcus plutonius]|uniref:hypothetical protein n=1 Tax=Melissococcus plutonius TaxID=33970 RepID=UPI0021E5DDA9|nr:hypothetical protein [Melissococcus plutonius]MCV2520396.1 hypothetical protein [Melissococcus plutonius]